MLYIINKLNLFKGEKIKHNNEKMLTGRGECAILNLLASEWLPALLCGHKEMTLDALVRTVKGHFAELLGSICG